MVLALGLMTNVATHINESKRKKEIVLKYRDSGLEEKLSARISRFNMVNRRIKKLAFLNYNNVVSLKSTLWQKNLLESACS